MLIKDKDILSNKPKEELNKSEETNVKPKSIASEYTKKAWVNVFDYYLRGISENFIHFHGRATPLEFWGFMAISGILFFPLYLLGCYSGNKMVIFYFYLATLLPSLAICVRRFHDLSKSAILYFLCGFISFVSCFFIGFYSLILIFLWFIVMIKLMLKSSYIGDVIFGNYVDEAKEYDGNYDKIVRKFFSIAISCFIIFSTYSYMNIDLWKQQNMQKIAFEDIFNLVYKDAKENNLSEEQIKQANDEVRNFLKTLSGQKISEDDLKKQINLIIENIIPKESMDAK